MHRVLSALALSLGCLSLIPAAYADAPMPAKHAEVQSAAPQPLPVYVNSIPFGVQTFIPIAQEFLAGPLHQVIRAEQNTAGTKIAFGNIRRLTRPADIQTLKALLKDPHCVVQAQGSGNMRLLVEAEGGETQVFVDTDGVVLSGSHSWRLTSGDFTRLGQTLNRIYAAPL